MIHPKLPAFLRTLYDPKNIKNGAIILSAAVLAAGVYGPGFAILGVAIIGTGLVRVSDLWKEYKKDIAPVTQNEGYTSSKTMVDSNLGENAKTKEQLDHMEYLTAQEDNNKLYAAWNTMHNANNKNENTQDTNLLGMEAFQAALSKFAETNTIMAGPITLVDRLNDMATASQREIGIDTSMSLRLEKIKDFSIDFIKTYAASATDACIRDMYREGPIQGDYRMLISSTLLVRDAAQALAISEKVSPDSIQGPIRAAKITEYFNHIKSTLLLGMDESTGQKIKHLALTPGDEAHSTMATEIDVASQAVKRMETIIAATNVNPDTQASNTFEKYRP